MFGDITVKCRPLRLAFLIPPSSVALRKAIQVNSTLWGGTYNPIIPLYAQSRKAWKEYPRQKIAVKDRIVGYVRAFDPDILVDCTGGKLPPYLAHLGRSTIAIDDIWSDFFSDRRDGAPKYGVGIFELLNGIYKEHFEVVQRFPSKVALPILPKDHALFWAAIVGELLPPIQEAIEAEYSEAIDIDKPAIGPTNFEAILKEYRFIPRNMTRHELETEGVGFGRNESCAFYMDATKFADIVDFWNLRALGRAVLPVPKQFVKIPEYIALIRDFVRDSYAIDRHNPAVTYGTTVIRSSASTMTELENLVKVLELETIISGKPDARPISLQHWYPRIWDEWAMGKDGAKPDNVTSLSKDFSFPDVGNSVSFDLVKPEFIATVFNDSPRYANEIYPKFYGHGENILADVLPYDHGPELLRVAGGGYLYLTDQFRIGRTGLIHLIQWKQRAEWRLPPAEDVFFAWLKDKGFDGELSTCGRLAKQMRSQLGGWTSVLTNEFVLALFDKMTKGGEDGKGASLGEVKNKLRTTGARGNKLYESYVERNVFQLGYKTQCTHCGRASWFNVSDLATKLRCPLCFKALDAISAVDSDNKGSWHLKMAGPFSVEKFADGSYSVLLALNFFEQDRSLQTTPVMSFNAKHVTTGKNLEADIGLMWQETVYGETQDGILFAECKSYNEFKREDFVRMKGLAEQFPGAILAFCTLRKTLLPREVREIQRIAKAGMKQWKTERPINPVLVLTGHELFSNRGVPHCWDGIPIPGWAKNTHTLLGACNATQAIHLGMPHWQESWSVEREKRRKRKDRKKLAGG
jgi:hypothetical protein